MSVYVDARGKQCPIPIVMAKKAISEMGTGVVTVAVDNEIAVQNLTKMANQKNYTVTSSKLNNNHYEVVMNVLTDSEKTDGKTKGAPISGEHKNDASDEKRTQNTVGENAAETSGSDSASTGTSDCPACLPADQTTIAVISSNQMGEGDEVLGKILMKGFIYALSQLDELPGAVIFYNSGAFLTCEGSDSIEDLRAMEEQGVTIYTCGTCLNHYGLTEKLAVGSVTNMYVIVETMAQAGKVIRP